MTCVSRGWLLFLISGVLLSVATVALASHDTPPTFHSAVPLTGWAWSGGTNGTPNGGIGWISFNCSNAQTVDVGANPPQNVYPSGTCAYSNHQVEINPDFTLTGYAWSSNIGWIKFGGLSLGASQSAGGQARVNPTTNELEGWARACGATVGGDCTGGLDPDGGNWDGWISLNSVNTSGLVNYGVSAGGGNMGGYAWGSDIFGWIDFSLVDYTSPCAMQSQCQADQIITFNEWCVSQVTSTCDTANGEFCDPNPTPSCNTLPVGTITGYTLTVNKPFVRNGSTVDVTWSLTTPEEADSCHVTSTNGDDLLATIPNAQGELIGGTDVMSNPITDSSTIFTLKCLPQGSATEIDLGTVEVQLLPSVSES